jgi:hypothetical protein
MDRALAELSLRWGSSPDPIRRSRSGRRTGRPPLVRVSMSIVDFLCLGDGGEVCDRATFDLPQPQVPACQSKGKAVGTGLLGG